ncbi:MAG: hypothetical protein AB1696_02425 [Planctomycetota bacterium]
MDVLSAADGEGREGGGVPDSVGRAVPIAGPTCHLFRHSRINDWLDTAGTGAPPRNNEDNALRVLQIIDAIYQSSEKGQRADVDI